MKDAFSYTITLADSTKELNINSSIWGIGVGNKVLAADCAEAACGGCQGCQNCFGCSTK